jgi:outer membrane immunogenic protein
MSRSRICHDATGGTVGGQVGSLWQASSRLFGVETPGNWANFKGSNLNQSPLNAVAPQLRL